MNLADFYIIFGIFSAFFIFIFQFYIKPKDARMRILGWLEDDKLLVKYQQGLTWFLEKLNQFYGKPNSFKAFNKSLLLSYIYPLLFFLIAYVFFGGTHYFAGSEVLPAGESGRWGQALLIILLAGITYVLLAHTDNVTHFIVKKLAIVNPKLENIVELLVVVVGVAGVVVGVAVGVVGVAVAVAVAGVAFGGGGVGVAVGVTVAVGATVVGWFDSVSVSNNAVFSLSFLLVLPIVNASLDWLSWLASRYFLKSAAKTNKVSVIWLYILLDIGLAIVFMIGLVLLLPSSINLVLSSFSEIHLDWQQIAWTAKNDPWGQGIMTTLMLLTTLLPTLIHLFLGLLAGTLSIYGRQYLSNGLKKTKDNIGYSIAAFVFTLYIALVVGFMIFVYLGLEKLLSFSIADNLYALVDWVFDIDEGRME